MPLREGHFLIEGVLQVLIAIAIFYTLYHRGRNILLKRLGLFLLATGLMSFFFFADKISSPVVFIESFWKFLAYLVYYVSIFFGAVAYITVQAAIFFKPGIVRKIFTASFTASFIFLIIHVLTLEIFRLPPAARIFFLNLSDWTMLAFFAAGACFVVFMLAILLSDLLGQQKKGSLDYLTTIWTGIVLMVSALMINRVLDMMPNYHNSDIFLSVVLVLSVAGFLIQISLAVLPGIVYDSKTKKPVPLALIQVFNLKEQKVIDSVVSGDDGHYNLLLAPGEYELRVKAKGYKFSSETNLFYRGESLKLKRPALISVDIAVDEE